MRALVSLLVFAISALAVPRSALADEVDAGSPAHVLTKAPQLLQFVPAEYPADAEAQKLQGTVLLQIDLDAAGKVSAAEVLEAAGHGFDEAALAAVKQFTFSAAEIDGLPAAVRLTYRYQFVLTPEVPDAGPLPPDGGSATHAITFDGTVLERGTRHPLAHADVVARALDALGHEVDGGGEPAVTTSDEHGRFAFEDLAPGTYAIVVLIADHARFETTEAVLPGQVTHATYYVRRTVYSAFETVVTAEREKKEVARTTLHQEEIQLVPGTLGDALKVVQDLPGVARAPYGIGLIVVRGSKPWDTKVYIDDTPVPQLFHFGGLTSVFNSALLQDLSFQAGNFNADYGRAIGGLIGVTSREPKTDGIHGYVDINVIDASALVEGPINDNWSIAVAARRSYIDTVLTTALNVFDPSASFAFTTAPRYYDYQIKADYHPPGGADHVSILGFGSDDALQVLLNNSAALDPEGRSDFSSHVAFDTVDVQWTHRFLGTRFSNKLMGSLSYVSFDNALGQDIQSGATVFPAQLRDTLTTEITPTLSLEAGVDAYGGPYHYTAEVPAIFTFDQVPDPILSRQLVKGDAWGSIFEPGLFAQLVWKPTTAFGTTTVVPGVRGDYDGTMNKAWADPRFAILQPLTSTTVLKAAAGLYHQSPDYRQGLLTPQFGNPGLGPEASQQYMVGVEQTFPFDIHLDLQAYYKWLFNQVESTDAVVVRNGVQVPERYDNGGLGRSVGVDILLRKSLTKNLFGWISYSLEKSQVCSSYYSLTGKRPDCGPLGTSNWTTFALDQPHHLVAILSYKLPYDFILGGRVQYTSGNPVTPVTASIFQADGDIYFPVPGAYLSARTPAFFQLDVRVDRRFIFDKWILSVYLDVQNVTNRSNVEYTIYNFNYTQQGYLSGLPIIPALGAKAEF